MKRRIMLGVLMYLSAISILLELFQMRYYYLSEIISVIVFTVVPALCVIAGMYIMIGVDLDEKVSAELYPDVDD